MRGESFSSGIVSHIIQLLLEFGWIEDVLNHLMYSE